MELGILIASLLLKFGPALAEEIAILIHKENATLEDWQAIFAKVRKLDDYVAEAKAAADAAKAG
jgi:hypothetical protein